MAAGETQVLKQSRRIHALVAQHGRPAHQYIPGRPARTPATPAAPTHGPPCASSDSTLDQAFAPPGRFILTHPSPQ